MKVARLSLIGLLVLLALVLPLAPKAIAQGSTSIVSRAINGNSGNSMSSGPDITADGRYIVFASSATNLIAGGGGSPWNIYIRDTATNTTELISKNSNGDMGNGASGNGDSPRVSDNGRFVVFQSAATNLAPGDTNNTPDVFLHDRQLATTERISTASDGTQANNFSESPSVTDDGRYVVFASKASNLVPNDTNSAYDIFMRDRSLGTTERISVNDSGQQTEVNFTSNPPDSRLGARATTPDGRYALFYSLASNLVPNDTNHAYDVFVRDIAAGTLERVNVTTNGAQSVYSAQSGEISISRDGRYVVFSCGGFGGCQLVPEDNGVNQLNAYVRDRQTATTELVSSSQSNQIGNAATFGGSISDDGLLVTYASDSTNLIQGDTNGVRDIFVKNRQTGEVTRINLGANNAETNDYSHFSRINASGRFISYISRASNLVSNDTNDTEDVFLYDRGPDDSTPPVVTSSPDRLPNAHGWYNADVTISWQATDPAPSSGTPSTPPDTLASTEGQNVTYTSDSSCDPANNCATGSLQLSIDKTVPSVSNVTIDNNPKGVSETATLSADVADALSGVANAEYFIGSDPGQGNGASMTLNSGVATAAIGTDYPVGTYTFSVRSQDAASNWSQVGAVVLTVNDRLTSLSPAKIWVGLKNSDAVGIKFDLKAEVYKDNDLVASGQINSVVAGSSGFNNAKLNTIPFDAFSPTQLPEGSQLKLKLYVRNACVGSGHNSGTARLWFNDAAANSQFGATYDTGSSNYFLLDGFNLGTSPGPGPKKTIDVAAGAKCSSFKTFGAWQLTP